MKIEDLFSLNEDENNFVCFLDILGFTNLIQSPDRGPKFERILAAVQERIEFDEQAHPHLSYIFFSDSIIIGCREAYFRHLLWKICQIQNSLLEAGFASRGGMDCGDVFTKRVGTGGGVVSAKGLNVFGKAYIDAYLMERDLARVPRVLISDAAFEAGSKSEKGKKYASLLVDSDTLDGCRFVNSFKRIVHHDKLTTMTKYNTASKKLSTLTKWQEVVDENLKVAGDNKRLIEKWQWLKEKLSGEIQALSMAQ